ncbi:YhjD/YihY/BrkB family envelope integrity protein [Microlunatus parietis]|uniref:Membrane protein n=1 Tax=Microlunatus parietis TaxID=682979 RepID=A0A7Y9LAI6_9ACTN|nr:YhjD/YihY/BrkB family envelope integrity protein [Microlunatus parietis]NYE68746.1 membrane protein [Microlunatus parietis]
MKEWIERVKARPGIAHLLRTGERYTTRLGDQFGAAITYFSVLALVPILMFAFSITGFVLSSREDLMQAVVEAATAAVGATGGESGQKIADMIEEFLRNWPAVGAVGLLSAMYSGSGWIGNLKQAVQGQMRENFDYAEKKENFLIKLGVNLLILIGLLILIALTFSLASLSTSLSGTVIGWLGLDDLPWLRPVLSLVPVIISVGAGWVLFMYLYTVLPEYRFPWRTVRRGALIGSIGLGVLQYLTSFLVGIFTGNAAAALFGPVIALMLFFNLFARLILFVAAWIATAHQPAIAPVQVEERVRFALHSEPAEPEPVLVPQEVAVRSVRVGMGAGYVTGAATGVGIGAVIAALAARLARRRADKSS